MTGTNENARSARIEIHRRLAFPVACLVFALVAIPLGARARRGGRSAGMVIATLMVCIYYGIFVVGAGLARGGSVSPWLGTWAANIVTGLAGIVALARVERSLGTGRLGYALARFTHWSKRLTPKATIGKVKVQEAAPSSGRSSPAGPRGRIWWKLPADPGPLSAAELPVLFRFGDGSVPAALRSGDAVRSLRGYCAQHRTGLGAVLDYFRYLSYFLFYQLAPLSCLVSALVTLGVMTKNNELVAFKAAGISLYRIAVPLLVTGVLFAAGLFVLDSTCLPYANQRQDELRNEIKGRPPQTYFQPQFQWLFGNNSKVYNYQLFDRDQKLFGGLSVFELDPATFAIRRRVYAARAHWEEHQKAWILESGWVRDFKSGSVTHYAPFSVTELSELDEPPSYFSREVRQSYQMDWWELRRYIAGLSQAGFDVGRFTVQLHEKLAFPLVAPIVVLLAIPFSILVGTRGAVGGLALGVTVSFIYRGIAAMSEAMGAVGQLPPFLAAWSPDVIFLFIGLYFFLNMPT